MNRYRSAGRVIASEWPLPLPQAGHGAVPDIRIECGAVPQALDRVRASGPNWEADGAVVLWRLPGLARFLLSDRGRVIRVDAEAGADSAGIAAMLLQPVLALASVLRGEWMLAGAAAERDGAAVGFIGVSATGKSTVAAALVRHAGFRLVSDSLLRMTIDASGSAWAHPQRGGAILWPDTARALAVSGAPVRPPLAALRWQAPEAEAPVRLTRLFWLPELAADAHRGRARGAEAVTQLLSHVAGGTWADALGDRASMLAWAARLAAAVPPQPLAIEPGLDRLAELADRIASSGRGTSG